jgi:phosphatidylglycerol---prolipoprotein diacylglyceryl transferase
MYPKLLDLGPITVHTYGLLLAAAFIAGIWVTSRNAKKAGIGPDLIWNLGLIVIFSALVGGKILLLLSDFHYYSQNLREVFSLSTLRSSGAYYGGLLLALGSAAWFLLKKHLPIWTVADLATPGIALGQAIGRLGCLSAGCCYGRPTHMPWGITFTNPYAYANVGVTLNMPLHPTQIYEALGAFALFLLLMWRLPKRQTAGQIFLAYAMLYAILRFVVEFFRDDDRGFVLYGLLSTSQFIAILAILGSAAAYYFLRRRSGEVLQN